MLICNYRNGKFKIAIFHLNEKGVKQQDTELSVWYLNWSINLLVTAGKCLIFAKSIIIIQFSILKFQFISNGRKLEIKTQTKMQKGCYMTERSFRCRLPNQPFVHLIGEITYKIPTTSNHQFRENRHPLHSNTNPVLSPHFHLFI